MNKAAIGFEAVDQNNNCFPGDKVFLTDISNKGIENTLMEHCKLDSVRDIMLIKSILENNSDQI